MVCALQNIALLCDAVRDSASAAGLGVASCASGSDRNVHVTLITFGGARYLGNGLELCQCTVRDAADEVLAKLRTGK